MFSISGRWKQCTDEAKTETLSFDPRRLVVQVRNRFFFQKKNYLGKIFREAKDKLTSMYRSEIIKHRYNLPENSQPQIIQNSFLINKLFNFFLNWQVLKSEGKYYLACVCVEGKLTAETLKKRRNDHGIIRVDEVFYNVREHMRVKHPKFLVDTVVEPKDSD